MTALFALLLLAALLLSATLAFAPERLRRRLRVSLRLAVLLCWITFGVSVWQSLARTAVALVAPGSARRPDVVDGALGQLFGLLLSLGGPVLLTTALALWVLSVTRTGQASPSTALLRQGRGQPSPARPPLRLRGLKISLAEGAKEVDEVRRLFEEYARALDLDPGAEGLTGESAGLPGDYAPPRGRLLLARVGSQAAGCVALQAQQGGAAELRRLFVRPAFRHAGLGRRLVEEALEGARALGYARVRLDTRPVMREAIALYRALGFQEVPPYRKDSAPGALFLEKPLP